MRGLRKIAFAAGLALPAMAFLVTGAQAQCTSTGANLAGQFAPYAVDSSVNTLLSAINVADSLFLVQPPPSSPSEPAPGRPLPAPFDLGHLVTLPSQTSGGIWAQGLGGEQDTKTTTTSTFTLGANRFVPAGSVNIACQTKTQLTYGGVQIGTDMSSFDIGGWDLHAGSTLGYIGASGKDTSSPGPANPLSGTFSDNLQIPFVGVYGVARKGSLFLDGTARWLYFQNALSDSQAALFGQHLDARGFAINGDIGYRFALPDNWFVEPSGGFIWSETAVDPLNTSGTLAVGTGTSLPGKLTVNRIYNTMGRLSLRAGTTVDAGNLSLQPFGTASIFREFEGNPTATLTTSTGAPLSGLVPVSGTVATTGIGTYGQFGLGVSGKVKNTGWLGYVRTDYRTGDNIDGWNVSGGLRYEFMPPVLAQPMVTKGPAEPVAAEAPYDWTGLRIGATLGANWGYTNWVYAAPFSGAASPRLAGILPGGLIGYDYQLGKWVIGAGAQMAWTNARGAAACPNNSFLTCENTANWLATATGRVGYTFWDDRLLTYLKAGVALGEFSLKYACNTGSQATVIGAALAGCPSGSTSQTEVGWTIGAGTEFALTKNWSVRSETRYYRFGKTRYTLVQGANAIPIDVTHQGFLATIGVAYRFDVAPPAAPLIAKY